MSGDGSGEPSIGERLRQQDEEHDSEDVRESVHTGLDGRVDVPESLSDRMDRDGTRDLIEDVVDGVEEASVPDPSYAKAAINPADVEFWIPTGCTPLDYAIWEGWPVGCQVLLKGAEGTGKTSLAKIAIARCQEMGGVGVFLDSEDSFSPYRAEMLGVDTDALINSKPETCEDAFETLRDVAGMVYKESKSDRPIVVVWDSVSNTPTKDELYDDKGNLKSIGTDQKRRGSHASLFSQAYRQMPSLRELNISLFLIVHPKADPGSGRYEDPEVFIAQRPIKHNSHVILHLNKKGSIGHASAPDGVKLNATVEKNKLGPPFRTVEFPLRFDRGVDNMHAIFNHLEEFGHLEGPSGGWYQMGIEGFPDDSFHRPTSTSQPFDQKLMEWVDEDPERERIIRETIKRDFRVGY